MTKIKSVWLKPHAREQFDRPGFMAAPSVCENGKWRTAIFRFSEQSMRWERVN